MNYGTEPWYKLYIRESTEDRRLPVFNRALRDFLLRLAKSRDDATILGKTQNPGEDLALALGAHGSESALIAEYVASMLEDGYLSHRKGRLWITNFVSAQQSRSQGAVRQQRYRDKKNNVTSDVTQAVTSDEKRNVTSDARVTSQKIRSEKRREETNRDEERAGARETPPSQDSDSPAEPERETICPLDLLSRPGVRTALRELAENLPAPLESLESEASEFVSYWTIGKGMGRKRLNWPKELRERLRKRFHEGQLKAPGAVEHERFRSSVRHRGEGEARPVSAFTRQVMGNLVRDLR